MKKFIFEPVGMTSSTFYTPEVPEDLATTPHILDDSLQIATGYHYPYNRRHAPSSTLQSNVEDMLKWARVNLNKGEIDGKRIYSEDSCIDQQDAILVNEALIEQVGLEDD